MKLSIIIPVYNAENYIQRMLNSILLSDKLFEVICVNDGSTDKSLSKLEEYTDERIKIYSKTNEGVLKTWRYGLERCHGDYVTIFDADDYVETDYIDRIFEFIDTENLDVLFTPYFVENENGEKKFSYLPFASGAYIGDAMDSIRDILLSGNIPYGKPTKVIKTSILKAQVANSHNITISDFEDWLTMVLVFAKVKSIFIDNTPLPLYST